MSFTARFWAPFRTFRPLSRLFYPFLTILSSKTKMARADTCDPDINKLNTTWYYIGAADFTRPRLLLPQRRKESFSLKLIWLRDRVCHMPQTDDPETLQQYARYYILLLIGGYLMTNKSNNLVYLFVGYLGVRRCLHGHTIHCAL
ncbi:hypothetical protein Ahy_B09g097631 [Arachis hypogaea]|uniref:Uncharacterized protein n=1 Tax=Arachis hypogaea TaxID=3818 RepID=A0A444XQ23_ARAHY|nr:hypothetical protein Ahy_B09g097631 [Arachis hypogaea]